ncbi:hypothetical protein [Chitinophaga sp. HK235]|uniref:hypothetical protein n=1 Tax=Chitinophaga sp. HK235 TaxID=2952571 RepID=UPI001BAA8A77|nr:hypothetical protein [Chitinophaga sp. HK235]
MQRIVMPLLILCLLFSCRKKEVSPPDNNDPVNSKLDDYGKAVVAVERAVNEIDFIGRKITRNLRGYPNGSSFLDCAEVNTSDVITDDGKKITLTFNPANRCSDQNTRQGQIILFYKEATGELMIQLNNYRVNGQEVLGNYSFSYTPGDPFRELVVTNGQLKRDNGDAIRFDAYRSIAWKQGENTADEQDDIFEIPHCYYHLFIKNLGLLQAGLEKPLTIKWSCVDQTRYLPVQGVTLNKTPAGSISYTNYGNGQCNTYPISEY